MSTPTRDGSPDAFPGDFYRSCNRGMSLRDWFAGMALQGLLASNKHLTVLAINLESKAGNFAIAAYETADAMLEQRSK